MEIKIKEHKIIPNQKVIEIREGNNLIVNLKLKRKELVKID